jgi:hypothetical protein
MTSKAVQKFRAKARDVVYKAPADLKRRRKLERSLLAWLKYYLHDLFPLPWADFHKRAITDLQNAIEQGGNCARALPRGSGKSTLFKGALLWAILTGQKHYGLFVGATARKAKLSLRDIKTILRFNDRLAADYPEICEPIRALKGVALRARAQTAFGNPTSIQWTAERLVFPNTPRLTKRKIKRKNPAAGAILDVEGITGDIVGHVIVQPDGTNIRPDIALVDDPQTRESSKSATQTAFRLGVITEDVGGSAGPGESLCILVACTVMAKDDLSDQIMNRDNFPEFNSERLGMILNWPDNLKAWEEGYKKAWIRGLKAKDDGKAARRHYKRNRKILDAGAVVSWPARKGKGEVSAIQHAMNLYLRFKKKGFAAQYQNDPIDELEPVYDISVEQVAGKVNGLDRREMPENATILTGFGDINLYGFSWVIMASSNSFARYILDYGIFPGHGQSIWTKESKISEALAISKALTNFEAFIGSIPIMKDKDRVPFDLFSIDVGGKWMQTVFDWINSVGRASEIEFFASRGWSNKSYAPSKARIGRPGDQWHKAKWPGKGKVYVHNADYWRSDAQKGFLLPPGSPGSCSLFGKDKDRHLEFGREICSETLIKYAKGDIRDTYEWNEPVHRNDLLDGVTGASVGASTQGAVVNEEKTKPKDETPKKERRSAQGKSTSTNGRRRGRRGGFARNW